MKTLTKIEATIEKHRMLQRGDTVAVGVSGGADSMLLLHYLYKNRERYGIQLIVCNVDHGIRGEDSAWDSAFVRKWCEERGMECRCLVINALQEAAKAKMGVEEYSRVRRYDFFASVGADKIATAHNLSDSVETMLFRLVRGTGARGLCGIPPVRGNIIRPLINCTSQEIRDYCYTYGVEHVEDRTNYDNVYARNYIRNVVLPNLEELNPRAQENISRCMQSLIEDNAALDAQAAALTPPLRIEALKAAPPAVAKRAIQRCAEEHGATLDAVHLNAVYRLVEGRGRVQLRKRLFYVSDGVTLQVKESIPVRLRPAFIKECKVVSAEDFSADREALTKEFAFFCDYDKIDGIVTVRSRREGDTLSLAGRHCTKSLKKLMNELKIDVQQRLAVPVICDDGGVIGLYGYALSERVAPDDKTENYYLLKVTLEDKTE